MKTLPILLLPLIAGCLAAAPKAPTNWTVDWERAATRPAPSENPSFDSVRISAVQVRAPFGGTRIAVLRSDGSMAFDAMNVFAVSPALLLKGATFDAADASGLFGRIVTADSGAKTRYSMEVYVTRLALDCRNEGRRVASVSLVLTLLEGRNVVASVRADGAEDAKADYSAAFSTAYAHAIRGALDKLPLK